VYNLGGISSVAYSWEHPVATGAVSGVGAVAVFEAAWRAQEASGSPVRVVQASSAEIFGQPDRVPQDEGTTVRPLSPYGAAKAYAHQMAAVYRARGLHVASCILYNHESPRRPPAFVTRKITQAAARIAADGEGVLALGNLDARRDWGWAPDYVDAMVRAARHTAAADYVVATGRTHSVAEFAAAAFARAGITDWERHVVVDARFVRPADADEVVGDASRARQELGWAPTVPFEEVVGRMVDHDVAILGDAA
jgi:GDPmannose 4,6-dehydratase